MKIVDRKTFLALPENTLFSKYHPCYLDEIMIKGETIENDFECQDISNAIRCYDSDEYMDLLLNAEHNNAEIELDLECADRAACYNEDQLFAVWDRKDVLTLIKRLMDCVK